MSEQYMMCVWQAVYKSQLSTKSPKRDTLTWRLGTCHIQDLNINIPTATKDQISEHDFTKKDSIERVRTNLIEWSHLYDATAHAIALMQNNASGQHNINYVKTQNMQKECGLRDLVCHLKCCFKTNSTKGSNHNWLISMLKERLWIHQEINGDRSYSKLMKAMASRQHQKYSPTAITEALHDLYLWMIQEVVDDSLLSFSVCSAPYLDFRIMREVQNKCSAWITAMLRIADNTVNWEEARVLVTPVQVYPPPPRARRNSILYAGIDRIVNGLEKNTKEASDNITFENFKEILGHFGIWPSLDETKSIFSSIDFRSTGKITHRDFIDYLILRRNCSEEMGDQIQGMLERGEIIKRFDIFRRVGSTGDIVMESVKDNIITLLPGEYNSINLPYFTEFPLITPQHAIAKDFKWTSVSSRSGKAIFPVDFNPCLPVEIATHEMVQYYGVSIFLSMTEPIVLSHRHTIHNIHYKDNYLRDYVVDMEGGSCLEMHEFSHLECPLDADSGYFILGKMVDSGLHLTAFKVPRQHTLYIPGGVIHSNDYLRGTWRTMLSTEMDSNQAKLVRHQKDNNDDDEGFCFTFE